jgi:hypothetical protein
MCWNWFKPKPKPGYTIVINPPVSTNQPTNTDVTTEKQLPYCEEARVVGRKSSEVDIQSTRVEWLTKYGVPDEYWNYWKLITLTVEDGYPYPAGTIAQTKEITFNPEWVNTGVLAHEICHIVWYGLSSQQKELFNLAYTGMLITDPLMILLDSKNGYMNTTIVEAHAEVYRYLGKQMPSELKPFYSRLL